MIMPKTYWPVWSRQHNTLSLVPISLFPAFCFLWFAAAYPFSASAGSLGYEPVLYLPIPADVSRDMLTAADGRLKDRLHRYTQSILSKTMPNPVTTAPMRVDPDVVDRVVIYTDQSGQPIRPDLERVSISRSARLSAQTATTDNVISFTFDSPSFPWTNYEVAILNRTLGDCYPLAKKIYGNPAFNIKVNIRKDASIGFSGLYYASLNEMVLRTASQADVICHELIHAFRDDIVISLGSYEEGMTRAAEVEIFSQLPAYDYWNRNHDYTYDIFYEGLIKQKIGAHNGNLFSGYVAPLLRYQTSGYAWAKALLENSQFLEKFNQELLDRTLLDPSTPFVESKLVDIATRVQPRVENRAFPLWYSQQGVLNTEPPRGYFLYQRINQSTVDFFFRNYAGRETMQPGAEVSWTVYDHLNRPMDSGVGVSSANGWFDYYPALPPGHFGRIKAVVSTLSPEGPITDTTFRYAGDEAGIFGIVRRANRGALTIIPLDEPSASVTLKVVRGCFSAPSLTARRGRFRAVFTNTAGHIFSKRFNKDASNYFLTLRGK